MVVPLADGMSVRDRVVALEQRTNKCDIETANERGRETSPRRPSPPRGDRAPRRRQQRAPSEVSIGSRAESAAPCKQARDSEASAGTPGTARSSRHVSPCSTHNRVHPTGQGHGVKAFTCVDDAAAAAGYAALAAAVAAGVRLADAYTVSWAASSAVLSLCRSG